MAIRNSGRPGESDKMTGISIREFARRDGCSDTLVRRALEEKRLPALPDGKLDPALVGSAWRKANRQASPVAEVAAKIVETVIAPERERLGALPAGQQPIQAMDDEAVADVAARLFKAGDVPMVSLAEAERIKENYLALLRELEYDQKSGLVVRIEDVTAEVGKKFATVRTRLLAIPAEQAPRLHRLKTVAEVQDALQDIITRALEELTRGEGVNL